MLTPSPTLSHKLRVLNRPTKTTLFCLGCYTLMLYWFFATNKMTFPKHVTRIHNSFDIFYLRNKLWKVEYFKAYGKRSSQTSVNTLFNPLKNFLLKPKSESNKTLSMLEAYNSCNYSAPTRYEGTLVWDQKTFPGILSGHVITQPSDFSTSIFGLHPPAMCWFLQINALGDGIGEVILKEYELVQRENFLQPPLNVSILDDRDTRGYGKISVFTFLYNFSRALHEEYRGETLRAMSIERVSSMPLDYSRSYFPSKNTSCPHDSHGTIIIKNPDTFIIFGSSKIYRHLPTRFARCSEHSIEELDEGECGPEKLEAWVFRSEPTRISVMFLRNWGISLSSALFFFSLRISTLKLQKKNQ